jgi:hypothetical protein
MLKIKHKMIKQQNYKHYLLPITINPLDYGKLIIKIDELNLFIIQLYKTNIALIYQYDEFNHVKFYREGNFMCDYKDHITSKNIFIRSLNENKFVFKNNILTEKTIIRVFLFYQ